MRGYYYGYGPGYGPYYGSPGPLLGQDPPSPPQGRNGQAENGNGNGQAPRSMSYREAYQYLVTCMRHLEDAGVSKKEIVALLIWFGIDEVRAMGQSPDLASIAGIVGR